MNEIARKLVADVMAAWAKINEDCEAERVKVNQTKAAARAAEAALVDVAMVQAQIDSMTAAKPGTP